MRHLLLAASALALVSTPAIAQEGEERFAPKPAELTATGMPEVLMTLVEAMRPYRENRSAGFSGWDASDRSMLVSTRFGNVSQLHKVAMPMGYRQQLTFEAEPVGGSIDPTGKTIIISKDAGGSEFSQLYRYDEGRLTLLTDGQSRNGLQEFFDDGTRILYGSTKRNGRESDIYMMDVNDPASARLVLEAPHVGMYAAGLYANETKALVGRYILNTNIDIFELDLATGDLRPIRDPEADEAFGDVNVAPDGTIWLTSDIDSDVNRLGILDPATGSFTPKADFGGWEISSVDMSHDGATIAVVTNEKGASQLWFYDVATGTESRVERLPYGLIGGLEFAPWGPLGFTMNSATSPSDAYSIDPVTHAVTRWTQSETGGLDPLANVEPELVEIESFDGEPISGFLYRPDPAKFPGARPMVMSIHGGPASQSRPGFQGSANYYLNELGIALFYPNVRGSTGYGKRFISLDDGPYKREDSVKDIGAFLDHFEGDAAIDSDRVGVRGGSYGGYMCYASILRYADQLTGAECNVAISNFVTFLENTQPYRQDLRRPEYGDERDPAQRAKLEEISPLNRIEEIEDPLFVIQGANDPRVPQSEADQLVERVRANGQDVWYLVGENEGHGFRKKENSDYYGWTATMFWQDIFFDDDGAGE
ncbi:S9 family peptidase [Sphingomicrobium arenosum]|uniref:S9 family peptidase n=1 Tax=Sphingomicrobium arenosum TaxID=2233861 RepID=UPI002240E8C1|nr:prolyl oligopeptidase family serine peptidase [Sphingomicrobium arenosum]